MILSMRVFAILALFCLVEASAHPGREAPKYRIGRARRVVLRERADPQLEATEPRHDSACLAAAAVQTASTFTGQEEGTAGIKPGQARSKT